MDTLKNLGHSIGSFAESLLEDMAKDPKSTQQTLPPAIDIGKYEHLPGASYIQESQEDKLANVEVPDDFVNQIAGKPISKKPKVVKKVVTESMEVKTKKLIDEFEATIRKAKSILDEMTTVGCLGVNMAGKQPDPMKKKNSKRGYKKIQGEAMLDKLSQANGYICAGPPDKLNPKDPSTAWYRAAMRAVERGSKKNEAKEVNPWAVCHSTTGPEKDDKFERCVQKVKSKYGIKK